MHATFTKFEGHIPTKITISKTEEQKLLYCDIQPPLSLKIAS